MRYRVLLEIDVVDSAKLRAFAELRGACDAASGSAAASSEGRVLTDVLFSVLGHGSLDPLPPAGAYGVALTGYAEVLRPGEGA